MKKRTRRIISFALVMCLILSTTTAFAISANENYQVVKTYINLFISNSEDYTIEKQECEIFTETKMYDSQKNLVGHMKYDKTSGKLFDLLNNKEIEMEITLNNRAQEVGIKAIVDSDGYYYQGDYTVNLGAVVSAASLGLTLTTYGYGLPAVITITEAVTSYGTSFINLKGELWMKSDDNYEYAKRIENVYELISENEYKIAGPFTLIQKKGIY